MKRHPAYSLIEVLVASAIFAGMMLAATAALTAAAALRSREQATYEATMYAQTMMRQITSQISLANLVTYDPANPTWMSISEPKLDSYGRRIEGPSNVVEYCANGGALHLDRNSVTLPTGTVQTCPSESVATGYTGYTVELKIQDSILAQSTALQIQLTVSGSKGDGESRGKVVVPPYTQTAVVQTSNSLITYGK